MRKFKPRGHGLTYRKAATQRNKNQMGHPFYGTYASGNKDGWRGKNGIRARHLKHHPYCVECMKEKKPMADCIPDSPHVDHINRHGGNWQAFCDETNLQTLCHQHHSAKTAREMRLGQSAR